MQDSEVEVLGRLERWYAAQCNGDWEHTYGVTLETLDNPGWYFKVELADTYLSDRAFDAIVEKSASCRHLALPPDSANRPVHS